MALYHKNDQQEQSKARTEKVTGILTDDRKLYFGLLEYLFLQNAACIRCNNSIQYHPLFMSKKLNSISIQKKYIPDQLSNSNQRNPAVSNQGL